MKKHFPGYYPMNEDEISDMWDSSQLVIDDSFLLDIIKLDFSLANELLSILNDKSIKTDYGFHMMSHGSIMQK